MRKLGVLAVAVLAMAGCTTGDTGKLPRMGVDFAKIRAVAIAVRKDEDFSVRVFRVTERWIESGSKEEAALLAPLFIIQWARWASQSSQDAALAAEVRPLLEDYDPVPLLAEKLRDRLQERRFAIIRLVDPKSVKKLTDVDAVLEVTLKEWGLYRCWDDHEALRVGLRTQTKMILREDRETVWERDQLDLEDCHPRSTILTEKGYLREMLSRAVHNQSSKIAGELTFGLAPWSN